MSICVGSNVTWAFSVAKLTLAALTPSRRRSAFSLRATQLAQVMPLIGISTVVVWSAIGPSGRLVRPCRSAALCVPSTASSIIPDNNGRLSCGRSFVARATCVGRVHFAPPRPARAGRTRQVEQGAGVPIWDEQGETMNRDRLEALQLERLRRTVTACYERVPLYRVALDERGIGPADITSLSDLSRLPFTTKDDFRTTYPYGLFAVPLDEVVEVHSSSGTTGTPVVGGYTRADLDTWAELAARLASAAGVVAGDVAQVAFGYGMFTGGFGLHYGLQRIGALVVPHSAGNTQRQIQFMQDFGTTVLICTPSYALYLSEAVEQAGVRDRLALRLGLFGAEACSDALRARIEQRWGISATDNYGLTEVIGPGVAGECEYKDGMHIAEDHFLLEVLDPASGAPVPEGEPGELVITSLTKQCSPVLRYR